ncbi:isochorismate synthase [Peribacillus saganii]|uniref:Isochorismate synthase MenF n=1 Tax=Peribacillus saganii TaxID=2303992 RepID=A0A372LCI5_9BACI|nr:isochorismate synthase [Peribacillus saganii]RFU63644.1 isochorismate synthase [Peribacillus saganii]
MAISYETELAEGWNKALQKAKKINKKILFSEVLKIAPIAPLTFYHAGKDMYSGERFFWQDPNKEITIAGAGKIEKIQVNPDSSRYENMENEWKELMQDGVKCGILDIAATGPLLFGGFSFDPEKSSSALWDQFGDNLFYLPKYMVSVINGETYLTSNVICSPEDRVDLYIKLLHERELLLKENWETGFSACPEITGAEEVEAEQWKRAVANSIKEIKSTELDKVVLAREMRLTLSESASSEVIIKTLMEEQPESFIFCLESGSDCFLGATPERLVKKTGNEVFSTCLAGSIIRGKTNEEDAQLGEELLTDEKNLLEHQYVVSMIAGALGSICDEISVPEKPLLLKMRHIQHLYTPVSGFGKKEATIFKMIEKLHPTPALGGLPKDKAMVIIRETELLERGFYAAPIGWTDGYGNGEFAVGIRSALIQGKNASLFAGCGIVEHSNPESEYQETMIKFKPMLSALGGLGNE